jgi:hypothetical protein
MSCCGNAPDTTTGERAKCHLCAHVRACRFCQICGHWFCSDCNPRLVARTLAAVREVLGGATPGCCGPNADGTPG